mgnify:CR=1 FL=1
MSFAPLRSLLPSAARRAGITRDLAITKALRACQEALVGVFGSGYSKFAEPIAVRPDGALVIACRSPAVAQTVRLREQGMLGNIASANPGISVTRLFLIPRSRSDASTPTIGAPVAEEPNGDVR